jgi:hypothetical protein
VNLPSNCSCALCFEEIGFVVSLERNISGTYSFLDDMGSDTVIDGGIYVTRILALSTMANIVFAIHFTVWQLLHRVL